MSKWENFRRGASRILRIVLKGEVVLRLDRFLPHILVIVGIFALSIYLNLRIDQTLVRREQGRVALEQAKVCYYQKVCALAQIKQVNNVEQRLVELGSGVSMPEKPAVIVGKSNGR